MAAKKRNLSLLNASGLAIGGMVGGGIFAVLGEAVVTAGNAAFISLGMGGLLALITGVVYAKLTVEFSESGGEFIFIEHITGPRFAGTISWFLILGYIFTISLYAYTFGAYANQLFGIGTGPNFWFGSGIIIFITMLNLLGVREANIFENILVFVKISILTGLIILGFYSVHPSKVIPIVTHGFRNTIQAAALVFVAYEGFQLLTYDYEAIQNHKKNLPKAVFYSISIVIVIYVLIAFVLTGSLSSDIIAAHKETALALLAQPVLGQFGVTIVLIAVMFATSFAILVTIFAISRIAKRISDGGQLPTSLTRWKGEDIPVLFSLVIAAGAILVQFYGNLTQITTFSSLAFLFVFSIVNFMGYKHKVLKGWKSILPILGSVGCASGLAVLLYDTYTNKPTTLYIVIGIFVMLLICRELYIWLHSNYKGKKLNA